MTDSASFVELEGHLRSYEVYPAITIELIESNRVISATTQTEVDRLWQEALDRQDRLLFDGTVLSVVSISPSYISVCKSSYKAFLAQGTKPDLFEDLRIRPLACSGYVKCQDGLVLAKRSTKMFLDPGCWELAPSGTFDDQCIGDNGQIDPCRFLLRELQEELGIGSALAKTGSVLGLFEQAVYRGVDLVIAIDLALTGEQTRNHFESTINQEYSELAIVPEDAIGTFISSSKSPFVQLSMRLLEKKGLL